MTAGELAASAASVATTTTAAALSARLGHAGSEAEPVFCEIVQHYARRKGSLT